LTSLVADAADRLADFVHGKVVGSARRRASIGQG
jgi:hypothetical protein